MASADKSLHPVIIDDNQSTDPSSSCLNDPNYAIICDFLQKFGGLLKIEHPDFLRLQKMIENTDEGKAKQKQQQQPQQQQQYQLQLQYTNKHTNNMLYMCVCVYAYTSECRSRVGLYAYFECVLYFMCAVCIQIVAYSTSTYVYLHRMRVCVHVRAEYAMPILWQAFRLSAFFSVRDTIACVYVCECVFVCRQFFEIEPAL